MERLNIYKKILQSSETLLAVLIDPDKYDEDFLKKIAENANKDKIDLIFVGGSLVQNDIETLISKLKKLTSKPIVIFPGSYLQVSPKADAILFLSLISGRNPEYLIGNHVAIASFLKKSQIEVIPTGYMIVESQKTTSVEYISNTKPIPYDKTDIAVATAVAGELLGMKLIYLEAGSGAIQKVNRKMIEKVKKNIDIPLIVGGGIKNKEDFIVAKNAGADVVVVGTAIENGIWEF